MTPAYGTAPKGERVEASAPASWESVTVIAPDGVRAPAAFEGALNAATFPIYVEQVLASRRRDVVVFDDLSSRLSPAMSRAIDESCILVELSGMCRDSGGVLRQKVSPDVSRGDRKGESKNEKPLRRKGFRRRLSATVRSSQLT